MKYGQATIAEMVESERLMVLDAPERYQAYYLHAEERTISRPLSNRSG
jgi:hypothetical protein